MGKTDCADCRIAQSTFRNASFNPQFAIRIPQFSLTVFALLLSTFTLFAQTGYALIKGSVFTPDGRSFQGAKLTVVRSDIDEKEKKKSRKQAISDRLGEFAFRVLPGPAKYHLTVEAKGFLVQERQVEIFSDERTDISIVLKK